MTRSGRRDEAAEREIRQRDAEARRKALHAVAAPAAAVMVATAPIADSAETAPTKLPIDPVSRTAPEDDAEDAHRAHGWRGPRDQKRWERFVEAHVAGLDSGWENSAAADEYDGYLLKVAGMVRRNEGDEAAAQYLIWGESEHMGMGVRADTLERAKATIAAIRADDQLWNEG